MCIESGGEGVKSHIRCTRNGIVHSKHTPSQSFLAFAWPPGKREGTVDDWQVCEVGSFVRPGSVCTACSAAPSSSFGRTALWFVEKAATREACDARRAPLRRATGAANRFSVGIPAVMSFILKVEARADV